jgi:DNA (cytosine-5)-methyltransferase 1
LNLRLPCHSVSVAVAGHRGVYGRLDWDKPAGTITTKCNSFTRGRFAHPKENRNITMREAARLQSFPDDFVFKGGTVDVAHQVGNAVPPQLAFEIASHLLRQLAEADQRDAPPRIRRKQSQLA